MISVSSATPASPDADPRTAAASAPRLRAAVRRPSARIGDDALDRRRVEPSAFGEVAALVLAPGAEQRPDALRPQPVELVDRAHDGQPPPGVLLAPQPDRLHHAVEHLAVVDLDHIVAARDAERFHAVGGHHADFGVGGDAGRADRVGVELHELAIAARPRLLVAEHRAGAVAAVGLGQAVVVFGDEAGERRGQVIAQRQPLPVVVLEREHALVRPVLIGQELAERVGIFDERRLGRLEAIELIDRADFRHHRLGGGDVGGVPVDEPARQGGADAGGSVGFGHRDSIFEQRGVQMMLAAMLMVSARTIVLKKNPTTP